MIDYTQKNKSLSFKVLASPRASRTEFAGEHDGALRVRLKAAPVDGAANEELVRALARGFRVSRSDVEIIVGLSSKLKQVRICGSPSDLVETLNRLAMEKP